MAKPTATLNDGTKVLGKWTMQQREPVAMTYANRTQAERAAAEHGGDVIQRGRPFYVRAAEGR